MRRQSAWIDVWPLKDLSVKTSYSNSRAILNQGLVKLVEENWVPKAEKGWKSSWVPFVESAEIDDRHLQDPYGGGLPHFKVNLGVMAYKEIEGINQAIEQNLPLISSEVSYNPCLSVGFITATKDGKVILQRRSADVHVPNTLIHEPCGYMTSLAFAPKAECDKPENSKDPRLFDLKTQLDYRKREIAETFGITEDSVDYRSDQDLLGAGWKSVELYFSTTGKIDAESKDLKLPEKQEVFFVPFEHLKQLIYNQGRLSKIDPKDYRPGDPREIPLIDETIVGLLFGYEKLTGEKLDIQETVERLGKDGLQIRIYNTVPGMKYEFTTSF